MINSTNRTSSVTNIGGVSVPAPRPAPKSTEASDRFSTDSLDRLRASLEQEPAVRPDVVELGRSLASDPAYPSDPIIQKLAELLVSAPDDDGDDAA